MAIISGTTSVGGRLIVINETNWSIESNTLVDIGDYQIDGLVEGKKLVFCKKENGETEVYGNVDAV